MSYPTFPIILSTVRVDTLLGTMVPDWNPLEARWRIIIKASENPWIEHDKVREKCIVLRPYRSVKMSGFCLYPGAGMVVMAVEPAIK